MGGNRKWCMQQLGYSSPSSSESRQEKRNHTRHSNWENLIWETGSKGVGELWQWTGDMDNTSKKQAPLLQNVGITGGVGCAQNQGAPRGGPVGLSQTSEELNPGASARSSEVQCGCTRVTERARNNANCLCQGRGPLIGWHCQEQVNRKQTERSNFFSLLLPWIQAHTSQKEGVGRGSKPDKKHVGWRGLSGLTPSLGKSGLSIKVHHPMPRERGWVTFLSH